MDNIIKFPQKPKPESKPAKFLGILQILREAGAPDPEAAYRQLVNEVRAQHK